MLHLRSQQLYNETLKDQFLFNFFLFHFEAVIQGIYLVFFFL